MQDDENIKPIQGWLNTLSAQMREFIKKLDDFRAELETKAQNAHSKIHLRIDDVITEIYAIKQIVTKMEYQLEDAQKRMDALEAKLETAQKHIETDESYEDGQNRTIAGAAKWLLAATAGALISWLAARIGGGQG